MSERERAERVSERELREQESERELRANGEKRRERELTANGENEADGRKGESFLLFSYFFKGILVLLQALGSEL